ncbi:MAG: phosphoribosylglycinamide formyltransferase [Clostridiales Family XIII bacterium]|jgi:phosphoribosylglycinamide formyltransferase-1|nr:phosphoribosylglycinamide formyltransferase [Clostridiales Family XIII bacterium]
MTDFPDTKNITVLVSGGGSNLQAIIDGVADGRIPGARVGLVISSKEGAYALERAEGAGIPTAVVSKGEYPAEDARAARILELLSGASTDMVALAGYMHVVPPRVIAPYAGRIVNIHPSLIPRHCGMGYYGRRVHEAVLASGDRESGATVHFVDEGVDTGGVIVQRAVPVLDGDTPETLAARVLEIEHDIIVEAIAKVVAGLREENRQT